MSETRWILELLGGEARTVELPQSGTLVLGTSSERAGFVLEGQGVDETHCAIGRTKEGDWAVKDLGSRYGTMLNGQRVAAARLKLGDQLVLGSRRLEVKDGRAEAARAAVAAVGSARPANVPERIGGYRVERLIGKGGMGAVYLAVQESLRRPVALKVLAPKLAGDRDFVHRFQAEARAAAALSHPNVVVVYDVGEENGAHYLSMEFMAGGSLEQKLGAAGPLPWKDVLTVLADAAAGLAYAESRGIVHRDIKPANLMYSGTGTVKIADLGLATTLEQEASEAVDGRRVFGTPHFISPEQARGEAVDHRSDLYSLGATAYRLLSGHTPFEGASTREILRALQNDRPRPLTELVPLVPQDLSALVMRLMEKAPEARFPTAEALRRECERLRLLAEHGSALEVRKSSRLQLVLGIALLLVVGGASAAWFLLGSKGDETDPAGAGGPRAGLDTPADPLDDGSFFGDGRAPEVVPDEEALLRAREREAGQAFRELPAYQDPAEREAALERLLARYPSTAAAAEIERELTALRAPPPELAAGPSLSEAVAALEAELSGPDAPVGLVAELRAIEAHRAPPGLAGEFEPRRAALERARIAAAEALVRAGLEQATQLAFDGEFDALRAHYARLEQAFAGLEELEGEFQHLREPLDGLRGLRAELTARRARVDEEERFFLASAERAARRALGEALGPGSGLTAELGTLDLAALGRRLEALPAELAARPFARTLAEEARLARTALDSLQAEFSAGGWRRKALVDPRARRVKEVRDVRPEGLVFERDGGLETIPWRDAHSDPDWFHQLFQARLGRDWSAAEARGIVALLRLVGATRAAELAREVLDPRGRALLPPAELEQLGLVFGAAQGWLDAAAATPELRAELAREAAAAQRLRLALETSQQRAWTAAAAHLEALLAEADRSLLVGLLSDGSEWSVRARPTPTPPPAPEVGEK